MNTKDSRKKSESKKVYEIWQDGPDILLISQKNHTLKEHFKQFGMNVRFIGSFEAESLEQALEIKRRYIKYNSK